MNQELFAAICSFKYVIFDMDGTLLDSEPWHAKAWNEAGLKFKMPHVSESYIAQIGGIPSFEIAKILCKNNNITEDPAIVARTKIDLYRSKFMQKAQCFPDIIKLLGELHENGAVITVATGSMLPETKALLDKFNLTPYLKSIVTCDQVKRGKPNPDTYLEAAARMGAQPRDCLVFEDTPVGFKGVKSAGMNLVKVRLGKIISKIITPDQIDIP